MKKILIVGAGGQIGSELVPHLRSIYGNNNVVAADISAEKCKVLSYYPVPLHNSNRSGD